MEIFILLSILIVILSSIYLLVRHRYNYWKNLGVPYITPKFPFGTMNGPNSKEHVHLRNKIFYDQFKGKEKFGGLYFFFAPVALAIDLDFVKTILVKDFNAFPNRGFYYNEKYDPLSAHLLNIEGDRWKILRAKLVPTFSAAKIKSMLGAIEDIADNLITKLARLESEKSKDVFEIFGRFTTDVIARCAFGIECNSLNDEKSEFFEMGQKSFEVVSAFRRLMRFSFPNIAKMLRMRLLRPEMTDFYFNITKQTVEYREKNSIQRNDFMNLLIQMKNSSGSDHMTLTEIAAQSLIFYVAGHGTTARTLTYCTYELSKNLELQEKAREHVKEVLMKHDNQLNYESVSEMSYLKQIIFETLRKYPTAPSTARTAKEDYKVPGTDKIIEKGTMITIPIYAIHNDPDIYPNPDKFDPDRFSPDQVADRHQCAFLPFGTGPRTCIGMMFALAESKLTLAKILLNFKFSYNGTSESIKPALQKVVLQPGEGVYIKFEKL